MAKEGDFFLLTKDEKDILHREDQALSSSLSPVHTYSGRLTKITEGPSSAKGLFDM